MITKPEIRAVVLARLDLPSTGVLWDVGAGSGSVAVEAALAAPGLRVLAVERDEADAERIRANAALLGALVEVVVGEAPDALAGLPDPDRIFVGGGGLDVVQACHGALRTGGRLVATFAALDRALAAHGRLGSMVQVRVDRAEPLPDGGIRLVGENPVFVVWGDAVAPSVGNADEVAPSVGDADEVAPRGRSTGWGAAPPFGGRTVAIGLGCSSATTPAEVTALHEALDVEVADHAAVLGGRAPDRVVATIDARADHPAIVAAAGSRPLLAFPPLLLAAVEVPHPSAAVAAAVGTPSVAEAAALLAAGPGARLLVGKRTSAGATGAVAVGPGRRPGRLQIVGLGPGGAAHRTPAAVTAVRSADAVVGYGPYVDAVADLLQPRQRVLRGAMGAETERAGAALALARAGWHVALVSSGDPGVFAMASVTLERAREPAPGDPGRPGGGEDLRIDVVPGVTAAYGAAALAGAPLAGPHAMLTLSDLLVPWEVIEGQLRAAAGAGLAIALYNPRSKGRPHHLEQARDVLLQILPAAVPVVVATDVGGPAQRLVTTTLADLDPAHADMRSVVLVGSADTVAAGGRVVTRRHHPRPGAQP
jgi:precorrin-3B C17-methyltransferase/precorrin-6Y C5,15-methyltransferase (decarboxylating) CbiT subunit